MRHDILLRLDAVVPNRDFSQLLVFQNGWFHGLDKGRWRWNEGRFNVTNQVGHGCRRVFDNDASGGRSATLVLVQFGTKFVILGVLSLVGRIRIRIVFRDGTNSNTRTTTRAIGRGDKKVGNGQTVHHPKGTTHGIGHHGRNMNGIGIPLVNNRHDGGQRCTIEKDQIKVRKGTDNENGRIRVNGVGKKDQAQNSNPQYHNPHE
eukprot:scaffold36975_cov221-Amphora_coffeaeformis.AAC.3